MHSLEAIEFYTQYHPRWFESVQRYAPSNEYTSIYARIIPERWTLSRQGFWYSAYPPGLSLGDQGWKLHVSVSTEASAKALQQVLPLLRDEAAHFKFLIDPFVTSLSNGKLWPRGSSGKFITIYPNDLQQFYRLGGQLSEVLEGFVGPYILSDRRWPGSKCVYYRYGGFAARLALQSDGTRAAMILTPENEPVRDERTPYWNPPAWVVDPFPEAGASGTPDATLGDGRFKITAALSFSNRGGVYRGIDAETGRDIVIKEARPNVELGSNRQEAVAMLQKEYRLLQALSQTGYFVQPLACFTAWEHAFLIENYEAGELLGQYMIRRNPLYSGQVTASTLRSYFEEIRLLWVQLVEAISAAHEKDILLCDLSFTNILVNAGRVRIFDLETAVAQGVDEAVGLYTPGMAKAGIGERANDYYALGAIMFGSIFLAHGMIALHPASLHVFLGALADDLDLPSELTSLIRDLVEEPEQHARSPKRLIETIRQIPFDRNLGRACNARLTQPIEQRFEDKAREKTRRLAEQAVDGVVRYFYRTASVDRDDRLFPADLLVFETNPLSVAYGASGVLYALHRLSGQVQPQLVDWVLQKPMTHEDYPPGLYLGQSGIAWVLNELGHREAATKIMRATREHPGLLDSENVLHGAAGYGMACLKFWVRGAGNDFLDEAVRVGAYLRRRCVHGKHGIYWPGEDGQVAIGYGHGASGAALFLLYLALATDDPETLELGRRALDFDLHNGAWLDARFAGFPERIADPLVEKSEPRVLSCYWEVGSAGVGTTLARYAAVTRDENLLGWLDQLAADATRKYTAFPQLFRGLAGLGNFLLDAWCLTGKEQYLMGAWEAAEGALLFRIESEDGVAFPGEQTRRECADLATGGAGIALFLHRLLKSESAGQENFLFLVDELLPLGASER